jgi:hypothetical protein
MAIFKVNAVLRNIPGSILVVHAFAEKAKAEIRDKQQKKAKKAKEERKPHEEFLSARVIDEFGRECVPIVAIKKCLVTAVTSMENLTKVGMRQAIFAAPLANLSSMECPIETYDGKFAVGTMREDAVTIGINKRGLTYRPQYIDWQLRVRLEYNSTLVSSDQLRELLTQAGWGVGICEGRPEKSSALGWGRFLVHEFGTDVGM